MKNMSVLVFSVGVALAVPVQAAEQDRDRDRDRVHAPAPAHMQSQEMMYGSELMTVQERNEYQQRMRALKTEREREAFRLEHHKRMQTRAKEQGKTLPDMPVPGMGPGSGMGPGMGPGPHR